MKHLFPIVLVGLFAGTVAAQEATDGPTKSIFVAADAANLNEFVWKNRPIIVFADSPNDPSFGQQIEFLESRADELAERDVVVLTDTDPNGDGPLRLKFRPRGFMLVLVGKDGGVKLRKPFPWDVRELSRTIDKMPIRQREIRERRSDS